MVEIANATQRVFLELSQSAAYQVDEPTAAPTRLPRGKITALWYGEKRRDVTARVRFRHRRLNKRASILISDVLSGAHPRARQNGNH